jgi:hypothetical protein
VNLGLAGVQLVRRQETLEDHHQHEDMEPQADPVARGQEDEPVEGIYGEADGECSEVPLEREIAKQYEGAN